MNRNLHNAMMAQYATPKVSGDGQVAWDGGVKCVMPSVKLMGAATQGTLAGKNLFDPNAETTTSGAYIGFTQYFSLPRPFVVSISLKPGKELPSNASFGYISRKTTGGSASAEWLVLNGVLIASQFVVTDSDYAVELIGAYPQSALASFLDALNIQVELGSTATAYEPYCGGIPAPNPSYPIMPVCNDGVFKATSPDGSWDGGQATAPELWAIPGTDIRDEWNPQTGWGVRRCAVIDSYAGEQITTPYISSTGELSEGAMVVYGIPDTPFYTAPARLTQPNGPSQIIQISGSVADCPIEASYLTHS